MGLNLAEFADNLCTSISCFFKPQTRWGDWRISATFVWFSTTWTVWFGSGRSKKKKKKCVKDKEGRCDKRYNLWNSAKGQRWSRGKTVSPLNDFCCNTCEIRNAEKIKKGYRKMCKNFLVLCSIYVVVKNVAEKKKIRQQKC